MTIENRLKGVPLPAIFYREGKKCYYDTYRKKLIEITPEETVRQKVAKLFQTEYGVPEEMISLEVPMSYYVKGCSGRADIIIHAYDVQTECKYPIAIIECKNEDVYLTDNVAEQAIRYCDTVGGKYVIITNGKEIEMAAYEEETSAYKFLDKVLSYKSMVEQDYVIPDFDAEEIIRFSEDELKDQDKLTEYNDSGSWIFGMDTEPILRSFAVNFYQALMDTDHKLPPKRFKSFELIEDIGLRYMDYGNAGGGHYEGIYRSFLIRDRLKEAQIVSLSVFGTDPKFRGEKRNSYTSIIVAIDRYKTSHNSLQYNVDRFADSYKNGIIKFFHNGQISSYKSSTVFEKIRRYGDLLKDTEDIIDLGNVNSDVLLYLDGAEVSQFVYRLIEYGLLREEVRKDSKTK